jgi:hypothetical protein
MAVIETPELEWKIVTLFHLDLADAGNAQVSRESA